jgi:hypothetical protein
VGTRCAKPEIFDQRLNVTVAARRRNLSSTIAGSFVSLNSPWRQGGTMFSSTLRYRRKHWIVRLLPLKALEDALDLFLRLQEGDGLRRYVIDRRQLVIPSVLVLVLFSITLSAGTFVYLGEVHTLLALLALILAPAVLIGSVLVQLCILFYWLENRALMHALGSRSKHVPGAIAIWLNQKLDVDMAAFPRVPWVLAIIFLVLPLLMLFQVEWIVGLGLIVLAVALPIVFAHFDR